MLIHLIVLFDLTRRACGGDCPVECKNNPCRCSELANCRNECKSGYFKKDYNYICEDCQFITSEGCMVCQNFNGCGQCAKGYNHAFVNNDT